MRCEVCNKWFSNSYDAHTFSGYGFYIGYCPEHCPREVDGTECDKDHPNEVNMTKPTKPTFEYREVNGTIRVYVPEETKLGDDPWRDATREEEQQVRAGGGGEKLERHEA